MSGSILEAAEGEAGVVDVVAIDENTNRCILGLVDLSTWGEGYERIRSLEERLNAYVAYWDSGQLLADFPAARFAAIRIRVFLKHEPDAEGIEFLERTTADLQTLNIGFEYELLTD